jgi:hypothetical protein
MGIDDRRLTAFIQSLGLRPNPDDERLRVMQEALREAYLMLALAMAGWVKLEPQSTPLEPGPVSAKALFDKRLTAFLAEGHDIFDNNACVALINGCAADGMLRATAKKYLRTERKLAREAKKAKRG